ncbi:glycosyltransferase family 9 protein [Rhodopila sp.]|uniref:glycosyltransferase family 9 protein n=1 Tax=Rhodopila sp. TaxID=2480087 RepID=UPI002C91D3E3|nr:glycosyltransferase family 9 protein [Rhodopila sp.]HVZ10613.1 glycosyltransferase family 9 protein [Rhodopila sp.]
MRAYNLLRLKTALRQYREVYERTGSHWQAARFLYRFVVTKMPLLLRQAVQATRRGQVVAEIGAARRDGVPLLGIRVTGGLGDYLTIARFVRDLADAAGGIAADAAGGIAFDIYCTAPARAQWVFAAVPGLRACYDDILFDAAMAQYDVALWAGSFVLIHQDTVRWDRVRSRPGLLRAVEAAIRYQPKIDLFIRHHPQTDGFLARKAVFSNACRADYLHLIAGLAYGGDRLPVSLDAEAPRRFGLEPGGYVTVHNGFDPGFVVTAERATKCYPFFGQVVARLKAARPGLRVVQLGAATSDRIAEADADLLGRTSLLEAAGILAGARLHIDNEGGLVHLARCLGVRSAVVFGPTPSDYFGYAGNINIDPTFCGGCWWINQSWMNQCPRDFPTARCMTEQPPEAVADAILRGLADSAAAEPRTVAAR